METIKIGSKGDAVKILQNKLGLTADGIFGKNTDAKVKEFQKSKGLTADGVVGNKTWEALGVNEKCLDDSFVTYLPLSVHVTKKANRKIEYLVIHYTGGSHSDGNRALGVKKTFETRKASADFAVDDTNIVQFNPDIKNYYCWSVGDKPYGNKGGKFYGKCTNSNSISIELCSTCKPSTTTAVNTSNHEGWSFTDAVLDNAVKLAKAVMKKYNIDIDHIIRHYDVSGKLCPALIGWNDEPIYTIEGKKTTESNNSEKWKEFKKRLA